MDAVVEPLGRTGPEEADREATATLAAAPVIEGGGTADEEWCRWLAEHPLPEAEAPSRLAPGQRLVVVAPHPDDEVLMAGAWLARHRAQGGACLVLALTDGEASHPGWPGLGRLRCAERLAALRCLGLPAHGVQRLAFGDGRLGESHDEMVDILGRQLRGDDLVLAPWRHDAHPDHEAATRAVLAAASPLGAQVLEVPVWMWHWARPADSRVPWHRLRAWPVGETLVRARCAALRAHVSQVEPRGPGQDAVVTPAMIARLHRPVEYLFAAP